MLLAASMPCGIDGDESIPIAQYGSSNIGRMKHIYRHGLWHRYGRTMQAIAGIHFNYSVPEALWPALYELEKPDVSPEQFKADAYFALITLGLTSGLEVALTGAEGWLAADSFEATLLANGGLGMPALLLSVTVSADAPAIVAADATLHGAGLAGARPALRCLAKADAGLYELFAGFTVQRVDVDVDVKGMRTLVVQNDESLLESGKPLAPFGSQPRIGSAFYVGSAEIFGKRVTQIDVHFEWKSPPEDFFGHYAEYFDVQDPGSRRFYAISGHVACLQRKSRAVTACRVDPVSSGRYGNDGSTCLRDG